jgi:DDE family transposase
MMGASSIPSVRRIIPMASLPSLAPALQRVLTTAAAVAARTTGFVQRQSKLTGPLFVQTLVFGWLNQPTSSLEQLCQMAASLGVAISPQGLDARFGERAARCLEQVLQAAVREVIAAEAVPLDLLTRFTAVTIHDSSTIVLPDVLAPVWRGNGGTSSTNTAAAVKLQVRWNLTTGALEGPFLHDGRGQDTTGPLPESPVAAGTLRIADLGYFCLDHLADLAAHDAFWLRRLAFQTALFAPDGGRLALRTRLEATALTLDCPILLGVHHRLPCRLLALRVPADVAEQRRRRLREEARVKGQTVSAERLALAAWTILVTNVPPTQLSLADALALLRSRWQIEMLIKLWKQHGAIDQWRTQNPWRILCELYAKLLAVLIQHWCMLTGAWASPARSLVKAAQVVRRFCPLLALALDAVLPGLTLQAALDLLARVLATGGRMNRRKAKPNTYQLLQDPSLLGYGGLA